MKRTPQRFRQQGPQTPRRRTEIICRCNNISRGTIEEAIIDGCNTMNDIFDATSAGVGPCGGSCRRKLAPLLNHYLATGEFPEKIIEDMTGKVDPQKTAEDAANAAVFDSVMKDPTEDDV